LGQHGTQDQKRQKTEAASVKTSKFQDIFAQRAQGFQIDFRFRNAPPRPPVGPCFIGNGLEGVLNEISQYKPLNAVEVNYSWKLHSEPDLGVPLAPSAMDPKLYTPSTAEPTLHPDDRNLLEWKGSLGDTTAEELKRRKDYARATARLALMGKSPGKLLQKTKSPVATATKRKEFSRVLDEQMQSWMKKTTYLSNDYSRKVHDFKSLARTKEEEGRALEVKQLEISQRRSASAITKTFQECKQTVTKHPTNKNLNPVMELPFLPNVEYWGHPYTHVVIDKSPGDPIDKAFVANVQKKDANARMSCQLFVPSSEEDETTYQAIQQYGIDVLPLKEEDSPHVNYCIWIDPTAEVASYLPISSRVNLSTGRPIKKKNYNMKITRRPMNEEDKNEMDERLAEVDADIEERLNQSNPVLTSTTKNDTALSNKMQVDSDDDSDEDGFLVEKKGTVVAEG
jgi:RNA polymerase II-associated factor 1